MSYVIVTKGLDRVVTVQCDSFCYLKSGTFGHITEVKPKVFSKKPLWAMVVLYNGFVVEYEHFKTLMDTCGVEVL